MKRITSLFVLLLACVFYSTGSVAGLSLKQLQQLASSGTPGLALTLLDKAYPGTEKGFPEWYRWTRARTDILVAWKQWQRAIDYLQVTPEDLPISLQRWTLSQQAWLYLEIQQTEQARILLRQLIWQSESLSENNPEMALWRRLIIRSYLIESKIDDAAIAMHRYQQDYASTEPEWLQLRARIALRQNAPGTIFEWPLEVQQKLASPLRLLAQLRNNQINSQSSVASIYQEVIARIAKADTSAADRMRYWVIAAEAASELNDLAGTAIATEKALLMTDDLPASDRIFHVSSQQLWQRYQQYGRAISNQHQMLIGDDVAWLGEIERQTPISPLKAKALLAVLTEEAGSPARQQQAMSLLADLLASEPQGLTLVAQLFTDKSRFPTWLHVPANVRHRLVEHALAKSNIVLASDLLQTLEQQPPNSDRFDWDLRRARVMVMGGRAKAGSNLIDQLLTDQLFLTPEQLDKLMQVLFDLQSAGHHVQALKLFTRLETERQLKAQRQRELLFWKAESLEATEDFGQAGLYYMRSATYIDGKGSDLWGQSARYNAANALAQAGLISDARRVYESLLTVTKDPTRLAVLRGKLQQLWIAVESINDVGN